MHQHRSNSWGSCGEITLRTFSSQALPPVLGVPSDLGCGPTWLVPFFRGNRNPQNGRTMDPPPSKNERRKASVSIFFGSGVDFWVSLWRQQKRGTNAKKYTEPHLGYMKQQRFSEIWSALKKRKHKKPGHRWPHCCTMVKVAPCSGSKRNNPIPDFDKRWKQSHIHVTSKACRGLCCAKRHAYKYAYYTTSPLNPEHLLGLGPNTQHKHRVAPRQVVLNRGSKCASSFPSKRLVSVSGGHISGTLPRGWPDINRGASLPYSTAARRRRNAALQKAVQQLVGLVPWKGTQQLASIHGYQPMRHMFTGRVISQASTLDHQPMGLTLVGFINQYLCA